MVVTAVLDELEGRLRLHLTAASALGGMGDECGEEKHSVSKLEKTLEVGEQWISDSREWK